MSGPKGCGYQLQLITHKDSEIIKVSDLKGTETIFVVEDEDGTQTCSVCNAECIFDGV